MIRNVLRLMLFSVTTGCGLVLTSETLRAQNPTAGGAAIPHDSLEIKSYTLASESEISDFSQLLTTLYPRLAPKPATVPGSKLAPAPKLPRMTVLARNKTVVFRGTKPELETVDTIVKLVQGTSTEMEGLTLIKLKNARVDEVVLGLNALELSERVVPLRNSNTLVLLPGSESQIRQVKQVIDLCEKAESKPAPKPVEKVEVKIAPKPIEKIEPKTTGKTNGKVENKKSPVPAE